MSGPAHSPRSPSWQCVRPQATTFWQRIRQLQEEDITVTVSVESVNKGGMLVKFGIYDGFIPVSQFGPVSPAASEAACCSSSSTRAGMQALCSASWLDALVLCCEACGFAGTAGWGRGYLAELTLMSPVAHAVHHPRQHGEPGGLRAAGQVPGGR